MASLDKLIVAGPMQNILRVAVRLSSFPCLGISNYRQILLFHSDLVLAIEATPPRVTSQKQPQKLELFSH